MSRILKKLFLKEAIHIYAFNGHKPYFNRKLPRPIDLALIKWVCSFFFLYCLWGIITGTEAKMMLLKDFCFAFDLLTYLLKARIYKGKAQIHCLSLSLVSNRGILPHLHIDHSSQISGAHNEDWKEQNGLHLQNASPGLSAHFWSGPPLFGLYPNRWDTVCCF